MLRMATERDVIMHIRARIDASENGDFADESQSQGTTSSGSSHSMKHICLGSRQRTLELQHHLVSLVKMLRAIDSNTLADGIRRYYQAQGHGGDYHGLLNSTVCCIQIEQNNKAELCHSYINLFLGHALLLYQGQL